ncbi:sigma factor-like helix-turn-helix DNA-binding protein [Streptomyces atratus]|uniref:sigma factor-like helix-turn-helix DNA-binding protein n=1 Tax=Streptomyces atratus TaxID=1893 RepID=UPI0021A6F95C|nr:sigma factor-like helix-turn-helix DNA-binding protein [Streptomyces atratus]MCT2544304.1 hypothetical protein [Streptomyces atratus]
MSIVAERPVIAQATRLEAGKSAKEVAEEIERDDNGRGPEAEPESSVRRGRRTEAELDRVRPQVVAGMPERLLTSSYLGTPRVHLQRRADVPMEAGDADRLGRLCALHHDRVVRYLCVRLGWDRRALAEDLAQEMWLEAATRPGELPEQPDEDQFPVLAFRARQQIHRHFQAQSRSREQVLGAGSDSDWAVEERMDALAGAGPDDTVCAVLELLGEAEEPGLPACYADAVAALAPRRREAVELICEGLTIGAAASRMGVTEQSVSGHLKRAVAALRPVVGAPVPDEESGELPAEYERVLDRLPDVQQQVVRLKVEGQGQTYAEIGAQLGRHPSTISATFQRAVRNLRLMIREREADPVPTPVPALRTGLCSAKAPCASGCTLRTARTSA